MLRIYDGRTRAEAEVRPGPGRELRVQVSGPADGLANLRRYLVADLIRRTAQRHRLSVTIGADGDATDLAALNIHLSGTQALDGTDLRVLDAEPAEPGSHWVVPAAATVNGAASGDPLAAGDPVAALTERGLDPLALRLAFLDHHYREPLDLTWDELSAADAALRELRSFVAAWANHPSRPLSAPYAAELTGAFDDDLDSPAALRSLRALTGDAEIPPGSKFETAAFVDQLLGLDVVSEVGRAG